ncbi:MAG: xanthine dehydrogenase accessory factor [Chlamydiales bacterium]|jgi:xanthine dehydrogenase accessory factor
MSDAQAWIEKLNDLRAGRQPCAMVVVTQVSGSAPREAGARMIVADGKLAWGTIGGGNLERLAIAHAAKALADGSLGTQSIDYPLAEKTGQCCGGQVTLFYETFPWQRHRVVVFGAGHVGQALGGLADYLAADVLLIDSRSADTIQPALPARSPFEVLWIDSPEAEADDLAQDSLVLVMTHSHAQDLEIMERLLKRGGFPYIGLIGSRRKWARFKARLEQRGLDRTAIESVTCPIGLGEASKDPRAIAISAAAELLGVMHRLDQERGAGRAASGSVRG